MTIAFSIGKGVKNNRPKNYELTDFAALFKAVCRAHVSESPEGEDLKSEKNTAKKQGGYWLACAFNEGKRNKANAQSRAFVVLDIDDVTKAQGEHILGFCEGYSAFYYPSFTSTPETPKCRLVFEASRPILPSECDGVTKWVAYKLERYLTDKDVDLNGLTIDSTCGQAEHIFFTVPECHKDRAKLFRGAPINVDSAVKESPNVNCSLYKAKATTRQRTAVKTARALTPVKGTDVTYTSDPMVAVLRASGYVKNEYANKQTGKLERLDITCPFCEEHTAHTSETETVYFPAGSTQNLDSNSELYHFGAFKCMHGHCADRKQRDYFSRLGVNYDDYARALMGNTRDSFVSTDTGIQYTRKNGVVRAKKFDPKSTEDKSEGAIVFSDVWVSALVTNPDGTDTGYVVEWPHFIDHKPMRADILYGDLCGDNSAEVVKRLASAGLKIGTKGGGLPPRPLIDYLKTYFLWDMPKKVRINRTGWYTHNGAPHFVTPSRIYGRERAALLYSGESTEQKKSALMPAALNDWKNGVAKQATLSTRIGLAICAAFAAPCLKLLGLEGGGFHFYAASSKGKTTALRAAASVYGSPNKCVLSWDATGTAIELQQDAHNDLIMCLDEVGTANPRDLANTLYRITNGMAKGRGRMRDGNVVLRDTPEPNRVLTLSSGELALAYELQTVGKQSTAGQEVRLADIPANADDERPERGVYESCGDFADTRAAADALNKAANAHYGSAGAFWLEYLSGERESADSQKTPKETLKEYFETDLNALRDDIEEAGVRISTQGGRVLARFAACSAAGRLATERGLTGWPPALAYKVTLACAKATMARFDEDREIKTAIQKLYSLVTANKQCFDTPTSNTHLSTTHGLIYPAHADGALDKNGSTSEIFNADEGDFTRAAIIYPNRFRDTISPASPKTIVRYLKEKGVMPKNEIGDRRAGSGRGHQAVGVSRLTVSADQYRGYIVFIEKLADIQD